MSFISDSLYNEILKDLNGETVIATPRVSRETIVNTLKSHTNLIFQVQQQISSIITNVSNLSSEVQENKEFMKSLKVESIKQQEEFQKLSKVADSFHQQIALFNERVEDIPMMRLQFREQKLFVEDLSSKISKHMSEMIENTSKTKVAIEIADQRLNENQISISELQNHISTLSSTLILPSKNIIVDDISSDIPAGIAKITLADVLIENKDNFHEISNHTNQIFKQLEDHGKDISMKAPDSVLYNINTLEKKVADIEDMIEKEEEQSLLFLRKQQDQLSADIRSITMELRDKIDKDAVSLIVHEKYTEIVKFLQESLKSSLEDEENFRKKAIEFQELITRLSNSKADRSEIAPMQEMLLKSEAMFRKINLSMNTKLDIQKDFYNKKELDVILEGKVSKELFDTQLMHLTKLNNKKSRTIGSLSNTIDQLSLQHDNLHSKETTTWKGIADAMRHDVNDTLAISPMKTSSRQSLRRLGSASNQALQLAQANNISLDDYLILASELDQIVSSVAMLPKDDDGINIWDISKLSHNELIFIAKQLQGNQVNMTLPELITFIHSLPISLAKQPVDDNLNESMNKVDFSQLNNSQLNTLKLLAKGNKQTIDEYTSHLLILKERLKSVLSSSSTSTTSDIIETNTPFINLMKLSANHLQLLVKQAKISNMSVMEYIAFIQTLRSSHGKNVQFGDNVPNDLPHHRSISPEQSNTSISRTSLSPIKTGMINSISMNSHSNAIQNSGQDMTFIGSSVAGGGFNLKSAHILKSAGLRATTGFADESHDLEASGL